jgi:hypothetical protein
MAVVKSTECPLVQAAWSRCQILVAGQNSVRLPDGAASVWRASHQLEAPREIERWEGPFENPHARLPQYPEVAAERAAAQQRYRERRREREAAQLAAQRRSDFPASTRSDGELHGGQYRAPRQRSRPGDQLPSKTKFGRSAFDSCTGPIEGSQRLWARSRHGGARQSLNVSNLAKFVICSIYFWPVEPFRPLRRSSPL